MKKKFKARKTKNIAEKTPQGTCYRFGVNPLIKQELLQLFKDNKSTTENTEEQYPPWKNFEIPADFTLGIQKLAQHMGVYDNMIYIFDV